MIRLIYYVHDKYEMREDDFNNTWDRVIHLRQKAFKDLEVRKDISEMGVSKFDIRLGYDGAIGYTTERPTHTFGFDGLDEKLDDVHTIMKDIHRVLEEHDVETIDILHRNERDTKGIVIVFHTNNVIEHVLYYSSYEEEVPTGRTMVRYRTVEHFTNITDNILRIALELDYMTSKKEKFIFSKYTVDFGEEVRLFLRDCLEKKIPTNYSFNDTKTREEREEEERKRREEQRQKQLQQQRQKEQEQQQLQQQQMEQLQQFQQQFQTMQQQMMQMMSMYQMYKQVKQEDEYEDDFEDFEEDDE